MTAPQVEEALRLANRTHRLAEQCGDAALGRALVWDARRWRERSAVVVVAGETRRGKTTLVNALLRAPDLLPVEDGGTSSQVVLRHADRPYVRVTRRRADESVGVDEVDPAQLPELVTDTGDPELRHGLVAVEIGVAGDPLLRTGMTLVDTPGIGSMSPGHRQLALSAASSADLLVMVLSADEPLLRSELDFLLDATERVASLVFVLNRVDLNPDWEEMRREHRDRIVRAAERREAERADAGMPKPALDNLVAAPMIPASARLELRAIARGSADVAGRAGMGPLRDLLGDLVTRRDEVRARNVVRLVETAARRLETAQAELVRVGEGDESAERPGLDADLAALRHDLDASARWRRELRLGGQRLQTALGAEVARRIDTVDLHYRDHIAAASAAELAALAEQLPEDLERAVGAVCAELTAWLVERAEHEFAEVARELGVVAVDSVALDDGVLAQVAARPRVGEQGALARTAETGLPLVTQSWALGHMAGTLLGVAALGWIVLPIGAAVVAPIAILRSRRRALAQSRQELERAIRDTLATVRRELATELAIRLVDVRGDLELRVEQALQERRGELEQRKRELEALAHQRSEQRARLTADAARRIEQARQIRQDAEELRTTWAATTEVAP